MRARRSSVKVRFEFRAVLRVLEIHDISKRIDEVLYACTVMDLYVHRGSSRCLAITMHTGGHCRTCLTPRYVGRRW